MHRFTLRGPVLCTVGLVAWCGRAWAAPAASGPTVPDAPTSAAPVVVLFVPDLPDEDSDDVLAKSIAVQVEPGAVDLRLLRYDPSVAKARGAVAKRSRRAAEEFAAGGVMWIRLATTPGKPHAVFLYEASTDRLLGRRVPVAADSPAAAIETVANIAGSVVAESAAGPVAALEEVDPDTLETPAPEPEPEPPAPEPEPPEPEPEPEPPKPEPTWARLWLMAAYAGNTYADSPVFQHAVALAAAFSPAPGAFVGLRYDIVIPSRLRVDGLDVSLRRHPISLEGGYRFPLGERFDLELAGRGTVDPTTRVSGNGGTATALRVFSAAGGGVGVGYRPVRPVRLGLRVGAEALITRASYVIDRGEMRNTVVQPHPARFFVEAGVHFGLLQRPRAK